MALMAKITLREEHSLLTDSFVMIVYEKII